jgi:hypothetical protein
MSKPPLIYVALLVFCALMGSLAVLATGGRLP